MDSSLMQTVGPLYDWLGSIMMPWGLITICVLTFVETIFLVGMLTPGEVVVVAGALVAAGGSVSVYSVLVLAWLGTVIGVGVGYVVGKRIGVEGIRDLVIRWNATALGRLGKVDVEFIDDMVEYFEKHGAVTAFGSRFAYGAKGLIPPIAGATGMSFVKFMLASSAGGLLYTSALVLAGWVLHENAVLAGEIMKGIGWFAGFVFVALFGFAALMLRRFALRRRERYLANLGIPHEEPAFIKKQEQSADES